MKIKDIRDMAAEMASDSANHRGCTAEDCGIAANALNYAADEIERLQALAFQPEIERLSKVARLGWQIVWSDALLGGFDTTKPDAEAVAKERLAQADAALKSIRPVSDLSSQAQPPIYICPGTRPCPGSGVRRVARDCPNCGQPCIPHPAFDTQAVPR